MRDMEIKWLLRLVDMMAGVYLYGWSFFLNQSPSKQNVMSLVGGITS